MYKLLGNPLSSADIRVFYQKSSIFAIHDIKIKSSTKIGCCNQRIRNFDDVSKITYSRPP